MPWWILSTDQVKRPHSGDSSSSQWRLLRPKTRPEFWWNMFEELFGRALWLCHLALSMRQGPRSHISFWSLHLLPWECGPPCCFISFSFFRLSFLSQILLQPVVLLKLWANGTQDLLGDSQFLTVKTKVEAEGIWCYSVLAYRLVFKISTSLISRVQNDRDYLFPHLICSLLGNCIWLPFSPMCLLLILCFVKLLRNYLQICGTFHCIVFLECFINKKKRITKHRV